MIRESAVAGQFYEKDKKKLKKQIKKCFSNKKFGPGKLPNKKSKKNSLIAAIVPHAGYEFSGPCAAHVYKEIAERKPIETFIILGPNHHGIGSSVAVYPGSKWKTPLGEVSIDEELAKEIIENSAHASADITAHKNEHSIEVQLPFLQFISKDFQIVPICMKGLNALEESNELIDAILKASHRYNRKTMIIASSDFTHYGPHFMYTPFENTKKLKTKIEELDKKAIKSITQKDEIKFLKHVLKNNTTICGYVPITSAIIYARSLKSKKGKLLKFYLSGDLSKEYQNTVTYAGIIFSE